MKTYHHALLLVNNETDGHVLLEHASVFFHHMGTHITLGHITADYRELDFTSDALTKDRQSHEVIAAKAMLSRLVESTDIDVEVKDIVSVHHLHDIENLIEKELVDLVMLGHKNRLFGVYSSFSMQFINRLNIDILITHISHSE